MRQGRNFDHSTLAEAFRGPGMDTRFWISYAIVDEATEDQGQESVVADEEDGQLYVDVTLKPSNVPARARVGMIAAGAGEAVYFPLISKDEVLVAIPEGDVRAGCVIIARLNNSYDPFPSGSVAGKDGASNAFGMIRTRTAFTIESGQSVMLRSAPLGGFLLLDARGNITLRDGAKGVLQLGADVFGYQDAGGANFLQLDLTAKRLNVQVGTANLVLSGDGGGPNPQSFLGVPSTLTVATGGLGLNNAVEHVLTTEASVSYLLEMLTQIAAGFALIPAVPPFPGGAPFAAVLSALIASGLASVTSTAGTLTPAAAAAIQAVFAAPVLKPPGVPGLGQVRPGIGSAGFLSG